MHDTASPNGFALIKRCTWLGTKISFVVLGAICVLIWIGIVGLLAYKSATLDVPIIEVIRAIDRSPPGLSPPLFGSKFATGILAPLGLLAIGTLSSAITASFIGVIGMLVQRYRSRARRSR